MTQGYHFTFHGVGLEARSSGALWWAEQGMLVVSDLHLGKSARMARRGGVLLPPYEGRETLLRLDAEIGALSPLTVVCLGDSFDDAASADLPEDEALWLARLMAGRDWVWIEGNHDPGPVAIAGRHLAEFRRSGLVLRHIARTGTTAEISGHYHPKIRLAGRARPAFLIDRDRMILPAFGAYTGGLFADDPALATLMQPDGRAVLTGPGGLVVPLHRPGR
jgi:hypothetical protein